MMFIAADIIEDLRWQTASQGHAWPLWAWVLVVAGALALGLAAFLLVRKRLKVAAAEARRVIPAHIAALESLQKARPLLAEESALEYVVVVSRVIRDYIQERFDIPASHRASEEFLWEASISGLLSEDDEALLGKFLSRCDRVKFARGSVTRAQMEELFDAAHRFVTGTIPPPPVEEPPKS